MNVLLPVGSYFSVLNLRSGLDLTSQEVSFSSPRYELYGGTNNSVLNFCPKWSLFLCSVTYIYIYDPQKCLNGTVEVALHFQTLVVDFSSNL